MKVDNNGYFYEINNSLYLDSYKSDCFCSMPPENAICGATNLSYRNALLATIGEGMERQVLFRNYPVTSKKIRVWDLVQKKEKEIINTSFLQLYFYDTCGLSSHRSSKECIFNSLSEFIERQSFILAYLAKRQAPEIIHNSLFNSIVPEFLKDIHVYNISILKSFQVYFGIGYVGRNYFAIGIGSGNNGILALNNLVRELLPLRKVQPKKIYKNIATSSDYQDIFNLFDTKTIFNAYNFLMKDNLKQSIIENLDSSQKTILDEMKSTWKMHPYVISFIDSNYRYERYSGAKNSKVFDLGYFPSLSVKDFTDDIYDSVEEKTGLLLDRNINFIPFP